LSRGKALLAGVRGMTGAGEKAPRSARGGDDPVSAEVEPLEDEELPLKCASTVKVFLLPSRYSTISSIRT
jgi:hypothetical protein